MAGKKGMNRKFWKLEYKILERLKNEEIKALKDKIKELEDKLKSKSDANSNPNANSNPDANSNSDIKSNSNVNSDVINPQDKVSEKLSLSPSATAQLSDNADGVLEKEKLVIEEENSDGEKENKKEIVKSSSQKYFTCPNCSYDKVEEFSDYCPNCNQKLDWVADPDELYEQEKEKEEIIENGTNN